MAYCPETREIFTGEQPTEFEFEPQPGRGADLPPGHAAINASRDDSIYEEALKGFSSSPPSKVGKFFREFWEQASRDQRRT